MPSSFVYEDDKTVAFLDIRPLNEGHTLIIPKEHYKNIFDIPQDLICYIHRVTQKVAQAVEKATQANGISIIQQNGEAAGQEILHLHVHVIPRYKGQKLPNLSELSEADREQLSRIAAKIRQYF
jgi:histidine triad (HIT) family protein